MQSLGEQGWRFEAAETSALELESLLGSHGIVIEAGSYLEEHILRVLHLTNREGQAPLPDDVRPYFRSLLGVHELARLILGVRDHQSFPSIVGHLRLLNDGNALQTTKSSGRDSATNKVFELLVATLAMQCAEDVVLDDPHASEGDNPDVLATVANSRWGIACKVLHSTHPEGFLEHLRKGVDQIEKSSATVGVVAFNLKNVLDHDALWPLAPIEGREDLGPAAWPTVELAYSALEREMNEIGRRLATQVADFQSELEKIFKGKKSIPAFLLWGHTATGVLLEGRPTPTSARRMLAVRVRPVDPTAERFLECLYWAALSDSPGRGTRPSV